MTSWHQVSSPVVFVCLLNVVPLVQNTRPCCEGAVSPLAALPDDLLSKLKPDCLR